MFSEITPAQVGARLRSIRRSRSLSLNEVETLSAGSIKAVVLGSYERGSRNLTIKRAIEIARVYNIPVSEILTEKSPITLSTYPRLVVDIRALQRTAIGEGEYARRTMLSQLLRQIVEDRQDWNGEIITLRNSDLGTISLVLSMQKIEAIDWLVKSGILLQKKMN
ncbi:Cro/C1-type helix-turn-helix domain containing protein [Candidatus Nanopelagicaceae bacterium]